MKKYEAIVVEEGDYLGVVFWKDGKMVTIILDKKELKK